MKTYIVKDKLINIQTKEIQIYYMGKDGYVHGEAEYCDGYSKPHFAKQKIKRDMDNYFNSKLDETHSIENGTWLHIYEVVEIERR